MLNDPRFASADLRSRHDEALIDELKPIFSNRPADEWEKVLTTADVGCVKVEDRGMFFFFDEDPHVRENGFTTRVEHPRFGEFWRYSPVLNFSVTPGAAGPGMMRGQHTFSILGELGYTDQQINDLRAKGVLDWEEL